MKAYLAKLWGTAPAFLIAFFTPLQTVGLGLGAMVIADTITGIIASHKLGEPINSDRFGRVITKSLAYLAALVFAHVAELYVMPDVPIMKVISGLIGSRESLSFYENLTRISGVDFRERVTAMLWPSQSAKGERSGPPQEGP